MSGRVLKQERFMVRVEQLILGCLSEWEAYVQKDPDCRLKLFYKLPGFRDRVGDVKLRTAASDVWCLGSHVEFHSGMRKNDVHRLIAILVLDMPILRGPIEGLPTQAETEFASFI